MELLLKAYNIIECFISIPNTIVSFVIYIPQTDGLVYMLYVYIY